MPSRQPYLDNRRQFRQFGVPQNKQFIHPTGFSQLKLEPLKMGTFPLCKGTRFNCLNPARAYTVGAVPNCLRFFLLSKEGCVDGILGTKTLPLCGGSLNGKDFWPHTFLVKVQLWFSDT
jgi:hypothetical protein